MNQKRGQVTFFIIIGIVILTVISITVYFFFAAQPEAEQIPFEYGDIETFVTGCLDEALASGVSYCAGGNKCANPSVDREAYNQDLGGQTVTALFDCTGSKGESIQKQFPNYEIEVGNADVDVVSSPKQIKAALSFPVNIKRGGKEHTLKSFNSEYSLEAGECIPCPTCEKDPTQPDYCRTKETLEATILDLKATFIPGEFVGLVKGDCLVC